MNQSYQSPHPRTPYPETPPLLARAPPPLLSPLPSLAFSSTAGVVSEAV